MPWIEKRSTGWRIRYRVPGQSTIPSIDGFPTKASAQAYLDNTTIDPDTGGLVVPSPPPRQPGTPVSAAPPSTSPSTAENGAIAHAPAPLASPPGGPPTSLRLRDWVDTWWTALDVTANTEAQYRSLLTNHILPAWGDHQLTALSRIQLQAWEKQLRTRYAHTTVTTIRKLLARICADAVDEGLLTTNPVRRARGGRMIQPARRTAITATPAQILAFENRLTCADFTLIVTAAYTGMRWGELAGLQPARLRLNDAILLVDPDDGSLHEVNGRLFLAPPKNGKGRTIHLPVFLVELLRAHLDQIDTVQVFTSPDGSYLRRSTFNRRIWRPACDGNPTHPDPQLRHPLLPGMRFHDLRHTHKTWMIEDAIPEIAQCDRLGHALHGIRGVYSHTTHTMTSALTNALQHRWTDAIHTRANQPTTEPETRSA